MLKTVLLLVVSFSYAKETMSTFSYLNTETMPEEVMTFAYNLSNSENIAERFNSSHNKISNKEFSSKTLSFNNVIESSKDALERSLARSAFKAYGINLSSVAGDVDNNIQVQSEAKTYVLGYGLSAKENIFLIIPTLNMNFDVQSRFNASNSYNKLIADLDESGQVSKANKLRRVKSNPLKENLSESGLSLPESISTVANIYLNYRRKVNNYLLDSYLIIPSGYKAKITDFIDFKINERSLGLKQGIGRSFNFEESILSLYSSYHLRTPFKDRYRVPKNDVDPFAYDIEENMRIKYGDQVEANMQYQYLFSPLFSPYLGLQYLYSFSDSYKGESYDRERYELIEKETQSSSLNLKLGFSLNSIEAFLAKKFLLPIDLNIQASKNLYGKNSFVNDWISLNLMVFYK